MKRWHITRAKAIVGDEIRTREHVFRSDTIKREKKVNEMKFVYTVLTEMEKVFPDLVLDLFEPEDAVKSKS